jgi:hypothetical protein
VALKLWSDKQKPRHGGRGGRVSIVALRVAELGRLFAARYKGGPLPDDDSGRHDLMFVVHHPAHTRDPEARARSWLRVWAPWLGQEEQDELIARAILKPLRWRADTLGRELNVTVEERARLDLRTVGAADVTKDQRAEELRERRRLAEQLRRRSKGALPRDEYLKRSRRHERSVAHIL